jgi:hypothetical protein
LQQFSCASRAVGVPRNYTHGEPKKKPGDITPGWEALLLSHIKAPAQGGKAGSGKPLDMEFNKGQTTYQALS